MLIFWQIFLKPEREASEDETTGHPEGHKNSKNLFMTKINKFLIKIFFFF